MHRTVLLALAALIAFSPATALANCEPNAGGEDAPLTPETEVVVGQPAPGGGVGGRGGQTLPPPAGTSSGTNPQAPAGTASGTNPGATTNDGGVVTASLPTPPAISGGTAEQSNDPKVKITKGGTTTFTATPDTSITGGITRPENGQAAVQGGTTRNISGTFTNNGGTVSVKTNDDGTVTVSISGGSNKFTGGTNLDGAAVPVDPATGQPPAAVTVDPLPADPSVSVNYQTSFAR